MIDMQASTSRFLLTMPGTPEKLAVVHFLAKESISSPYAVQVTVATGFDIPSFDELLGREAQVTVINNDIMSGGGNRYFHGIVRRFEHVGQSGNFLLYEIEIVPEFWRLKLRSNCRIFQEIQVQDIVSRVLQDAGLTTDKFRISLVNEDRMRGFCVQYRESDFDFVSRLLEEEGIFYFFEHTESGHIMVMSDHKGVHTPIAGNGFIQFNSGKGLVATTESVHVFSFSQKLTSGSYSHTNYNFKSPSLDLTATASTQDPVGGQVYDWSMPYVAPERGTKLAQVRMEELLAPQKRGHGHSSSSRLKPGYTFALTDHPSRSLNGGYLIIDVVHAGQQPQVLEEHAEGGCHYDNQFTAIPIVTQFRPALKTVKPFVRGVQTAMVVGPEGEEIYTDEYGRIKVQFHWDREGQRNETSSCWLRINQPWSGSQWGMIAIPRIGDEVLVDFIEGDPDRPIMVGNVNNAASPAQYPLPANKTQTGIKTLSTPNGGPDNFHELRFEDKKGSEEIYLQSEKDWNILVKNDKGQTVGRDETLQVKNNRTKVVGVNQLVDVGANHTETIGANKSITVKSNKTETVYINCAETIGAAKELTIGGLYQVSVGGVMNETVGGAKAEEVGITKAVLVGSHMNEKVVGNRTMSVGQNLTATITQNTTVKAKTILLEAADEIVFKTGSSMISMKSNGDIVIKGATIQEKASGEIVVKGSKVSLN